MVESVLSLCWEGHTSELATVYASLLENNFLVDCTISAGGQSLKAHKLVLCACSPYFQRLFHEETGKHTFLILLDATFETLKAMIDFMYRGETQIPQGSLKAFITLAQTLQIKGLNNHSKNYTNDNVSSNTVGNDPGDPSEDNQNIAEDPGISANCEDNPENSSQLHPHCSDSYQDSVKANSSLPFEGYSASRDEEWCSQEYQRPEGGEMEVVVKREPLHAVISETSNNAWHAIGEHVAGNVTSEVDQRTVSVFGAPDLNQHSNCHESSFGNVQSMEILPPPQQQQQQHRRLRNEVSSVQNFAEQEESLPPVVFIPVNEESEEPMDDRDCQLHDANEKVEGAGPARGRHNFLQSSNCHEFSNGNMQSSEMLPTQQRHLQLRNEEPSDRHFVEQEESLPPVVFVPINEESEEPIDDRDLPVDNTDERIEETESAFHRHNFLQSSSDDVIVLEEEQPAPQQRGARLRGPGAQESVTAASQPEAQTRQQPPAEAPPHASFALSALPRAPSRRKRFACDVCGMTYADRKNLACHRNTHTGERPYSCEFCHKAFAQKQDLTSHRRTHTGERPYRCDACGMAFARSDTLRTHKRKHTGERPYRCDECWMGFHRPSSLAQHRLKHRGKGP